MAVEFQPVVGSGLTISAASTKAAGC